jgi:hypothetical protein
MAREYTLLVAPIACNKVEADIQHFQRRLETYQFSLTMDM